MASLFDYTLKQLDELEEDAIALPSFTAENAWELGVLARQVTIEKFPSKAVVIDIATSTHQVLFHTVTKGGASPDNEQWVQRKKRVVLRFGRSSFNVGQQMRLKGSTLEKARFCPPADYADHGGCVPLRLVNSDAIIGTLTLSGLAQDQDHLLAIEILKEFKKTLESRN